MPVQVAICEPKTCQSPRKRHTIKNFNQREFNGGNFIDRKAETYQGW